MARVFISHSSRDDDWATRLHEWLTSAGHEVFLDRDLRAGITVGEQWRDRLHERLRWADAVLCVVTAAFRGSVWCTAEVSTAQALGSRLLPVTAQAGTSHPLLDGAVYQAADAATDPQRARLSVLEALRRLDAAGGAGWQDGRSPFPGLLPFDADLHRAFFGRDQETRDLASQLRLPASGRNRGILTITGSSGSGKSSLARAGLLPVMAADTGWWALPPWSLAATRSPPSPALSPRPPRN